MATQVLNRHFLAVAALAASTAGPYLVSDRSPLALWSDLSGSTHVPAKAELPSYSANSSNFSALSDAASNSYSSATSAAKDYVAAGTAAAEKQIDEAANAYGNAAHGATGPSAPSKHTTGGGATSPQMQAISSRNSVTPANPIASETEAAKKKLIEGPTPRELAEVLRFDITTHWIIARWPRVTTGLAVMELQGYRVPLVTGTDEDGLAGSMTYYFDKHQVCERIIFHGTSGDPRKLVYLVTSRFGLEREITNDPGLTLFRKKSGARVDSELRIRPARVIRADAPRARYEIELAIKRPS